MMIFPTSEHSAVFPSFLNDFFNFHFYDSLGIAYFNKIVLYREFLGQLILKLKEE